MKKIILYLIATVILILLLVFFSALTMPKYVSESREGNLISEYYSEVEAGNGHQVVFIGDCEAYSSFVPPLLWEKYGITSFVRGSPSQSIVQSYALVCETLDYEKPEAIVLSVYALCRDGGCVEAYNRMTLDGMRPSIHKLLAVLGSVGEEESVISYFVPLLRFHSRWDELQREDLEYIFSRPCVSHNGYFMQKGVLADGGGECEEGAGSTSLPKENLDYLRRIAKECSESGVELILVKSPISSWRYPWYDEWDRELETFLKPYGIRYYNMIESAADIGIDMRYDSYDGGLHLNLYGAEKTTLYFGEILKREHNIKGSTDVHTDMVWSEKLEKYYRERYE